MKPTNQKYLADFAQVLKSKQGHRSVAEMAMDLGVSPNTIYKVLAGTLRPGVGLMGRVLDYYPDLYDLAMMVYFGPRPHNVLPVPEDYDHTAQSFGQAFKAMQGPRNNAEYAVFLGIGYLTVYTVWKGNPTPDISVLQKIVAKVPELYDLAAAVHFSRGHKGW